ncbi:LysR family transcriptional regulator [Streptomyces werraensis]|uniref:LysR family transcriptional regulator n=1 Tax=Streptomyces werraensis TaxID=68284 RepID=UPI0037CEEFDE
MEQVPSEERPTPGAAGRPETSGDDHDPTTHQLRLFLTLARELHFGRAAQRLYMTQPSLSRQIRLLENRLGVTLVDRTSRSVRLTEAGRTLLPEAENVLTAMSRLRSRAAEQSRRVRGRLVLGFVAGESAMPYTHAILDELTRRHPAVSVELRLLTFGDQFERLADDDVDAALLRPPLPPPLRTMTLAVEPRVACLPSSDPLADPAVGRPLTLTDLAEHRMVDMPASVSRTWWDDWTVNPRPDGTPVQYGPVVTDIEGLLTEVARGRAISFLPEAARRLYPRPGIHYVHVTDAPMSSAALAWLPGRHERPTVAALLDAARAVAPTFADATSSGTSRTVSYSAESSSAYSKNFRL